MSGSGGGKFLNLGTSDKVALGLISGVQAQNKIGANFAVGTTQEDIWTVGGTETYLTSAETMDIVSADAADDIAGTGAQKVKIFGLDDSFNIVSEEIDMDGITPVTTTQTFLRIYRAEVTQAGSGEENAGLISITASTAATAHGEILAGGNQTLKSQFTVPDGKYLLMKDIEIGTLRADEAEVVIAFRTPGGVFKSKRLYNIFESDASFRFDPTLIFEPHTDIVIRATDTGAGGIAVTVAYDFYIVDQSLYNATNQFAG